MARSNTKEQKTKKTKKSKTTAQAKYPRHTLEQSLRIPRGILEQNAGRECSDQESATFAGLKYNRGYYTVEIGSAIKYGLLTRPSTGKLKVTELAKKILKPQSPSEKLSALREAVLMAPNISEVYNHYRNENLPDVQFFINALTERFGIPVEKTSEFQEIFLSSLRFADLVEEHNGKFRVIDATDYMKGGDDKSPTLKKLEKAVKVSAGDSCFVMMPFASPVGSYYKKVYEPAIEKAGLRAIRADDEIFKTGQIIDQIWTGILNCKVLIAELTGRNPNVFYELGLAHAKGKPVVLVCSNEADVPFDLRHIRVIYYDITDPFWGQKLIDKIAENILSALQNPEEAIFHGVMSDKK